MNKKVLIQNNVTELINSIQNSRSFTFSNWHFDFRKYGSNKIIYRFELIDNKNKIEYWYALPIEEKDIVDNMTELQVKCMYKKYQQKVIELLFKSFEITVYKIIDQCEN